MLLGRKDGSVSLFTVAVSADGSEFFNTGCSTQRIGGADVRAVFNCDGTRVFSADASSLAVHQWVLKSVGGLSRVGELASEASSVLESITMGTKSLCAVTEDDLSEFYTALADGPIHEWSSRKDEEPHGD